MSQTVIRGTQILNNTVQRQDLDTSTVGQAVVTKVVQGTNVTLSSTGADSGTGDVTISVPSLVPTGTVLDFAGGSAPSGFLLCDGSAVSRTTYSGLYTVLGSSSSPWGQGDGSTTFNVPDLRGRVTIGVGQGTYSGATNRALAANGGEETHQLTTAELASHSHVVFGNGVAVAAGGVSCNQLFATTSNGNVNSATAGSGTAHNTMPPFAVLNKIIKT